MEALLTIAVMNRTKSERKKFPENPSVTLGFEGFGRSRTGKQLVSKGLGLCHQAVSAEPVWLHKSRQEKSACTTARLNHRNF